MRHAGKPALLLGLLLATTMTTHAVDAPPTVLLWPNGAPGSEGKTDPEKTNSAPTMPIQVTSVHKPSLTVYLPKKSPAGGWPARFREWLDDRGFLGKK